MRISDPHKNSKFPWKYVPIPVPAAHERFVADNKKGSHHYTKLRGLVDERFYICDDNYMWERRSVLKDKKLWLLPLKAKPGDIVVFLTGFRGTSQQSSMLGLRLDGKYDTAARYTSGGLWVLNSVANGEFKPLACLSWAPSDGVHCTIIGNGRPSRSCRADIGNSPRTWVRPGSTTVHPCTKAN